MDRYVYILYMFMRFITFLNYEYLNDVYTIFYHNIIGQYLYFVYIAYYFCIIPRWLNTYTPDHLNVTNHVQTKYNIIGFNIAHNAKPLIAKLWHIIIYKLEKLICCFQIYKLFYNIII